MLLLCTALKHLVVLYVYFVFNVIFYSIHPVLCACFGTKICVYVITECFQTCIIMCSFSRGAAVCNE